MKLRQQFVLKEKREKGNETNRNVIDDLKLKIQRKTNRKHE